MVFVTFGVPYGRMQFWLGVPFPPDERQYRPAWHGADVWNAEM